MSSRRSSRCTPLFVGVDWAQDHHEVCVMAEDGMVLGKRRVRDSGGPGSASSMGSSPNTRTMTSPWSSASRSPWLGGLVTARRRLRGLCHQPMASARHRDRHATSGAKSDPGDANVLADLIRTGRRGHRPIAGDSDLAEGVTLLTRAHQSAIWGRQRQLNALRSSLRSYHLGDLAPFGTDRPAQLPWPCSPSPPHFRTAVPAVFGHYALPSWIVIHNLA